jgi:peptidoglycan hydrolase-like protein with peptidoglycan-binding domain
LPSPRRPSSPGSSPRASKRSTGRYLDLDDLEGAQKALLALGYKPGVADGLEGPRTQAAVRASRFMVV